MDARTELPLDVVVRASDWERLYQHLFTPDGCEGHAFALGGLAVTPHGTRLLVREWLLTRPDECAERSRTNIRLQLEYHQAVLMRCLAEGWSLIEVHCHPFGDAVAFSDVDWANDEEKFPYVAERIPGIRHVTLVVSPTGAVMGHTWDPAGQQIVPVREVRLVGSRVRRLPADGHAPGGEVPGGEVPGGEEPAATGSTASDDSAHPADEPSEEAGARYHRQILAFGVHSQQMLQAARVGVVGLGGTGSVVVQLLAHAGIRRFVLVDPDRLELSNVSRVVGSGPNDVGRPKVAVAARLIRRLHGRAAQIELVPASILEESALQALRDVDVLIGATDTLASRLALATLAVRYLLPYVDLGLRVSGQQGRLAECFGQVRCAQPDGPCLLCLGGLDLASAARELETPEERAMQAAAGYGTGMAGPVPALAPINAAIASLGAWRVLGVLTGVHEAPPYGYLDFARQRWETLTASSARDCLLCAEAGMGDVLPWPHWVSAHLPTAELLPVAGA